MANLKINSTNHSLSNYPAGNVINIEQDTYTSSNDTTSGYVTACEIEYTIKEAGSTLYVDGHFQYTTIKSNSKLKVSWSDDDFSSSTAVSESSGFGLRHNASDWKDQFEPFHEKIVHAKSAGTTVKVRVEINRNGGTGTVSANGNDSARIRIMEVK